MYGLYSDTYGSVRSGYTRMHKMGFTEIFCYPFKPSRCIKASFHIPENRLYFTTTKGFRMNISMKQVYQYIAIFFTFSPTSNHLHPLQVENCDSNSRLVVDEDDNVKSGLKGSSTELLFRGRFGSIRSRDGVQYDPYSVQYGPYSFIYSVVGPDKEEKEYLVLLNVTAHITGSY